MRRGDLGSSPCPATDFVCDLGKVSGLLWPQFLLQLARLPYILARSDG